ncbi:MAG: glycosyltransferase involved in cell wall biosynthesis, partial [Arenicella sp.]
MISVVIPCRNEVKNIAECIIAISDSKFSKPTEIEILVIDGQSDDGTIEVLNELKSKFTNLKVIENVKRVTPVAFNLGVKEAQGDYIQIIGARQVISRDYLAKAKATLEEKRDVWCVGGGVENVFQSEESKN